MSRLTASPSHEVLEAQSQADEIRADSVDHGPIKDLSRRVVGTPAGVRNRQFSPALDGASRIWQDSRVYFEIVGEIAQAEIHWYEAAGIGKREFKIKRILYN